MIQMNEFKLKDRNGEILCLGDKIEFCSISDIDYITDCDKVEVTFKGKVVFCCGTYGIGSNDYIPDEVKYCGNDNFVSFWEIYNKLNLDQFDDISEYIELLKDDCADCPFNSKCENQDKCKE